MKKQLESIIEFTRHRVKAKRFEHIKNVVQLSLKFAKILNQDPFKVAIAGYLHDSFKEEKSSNLINLAQQYHMPLNTIDIENAHLLHGPVAALYARYNLKIEDNDILEAISSHTLGRPQMSEIAKITFLADCLEIDRNIDNTFPIWQALIDPNQKITKKQITKKFIKDINFKEYNLNIDKAICTACNQSIIELIGNNKIIHPTTIETRNYYLNSIKNKSRLISEST